MNNESSVQEIIISRSRLFTSGFYYFGKEVDRMRYIYRAYITINGRRVYARWYGHKAWRFPVDD